MKTIHVGFLGLGTVGQGAWEQLQKKSSTWEQKLGVKIIPIIAAVRDLGKSRDIQLDSDQITDQTDLVVTDSNVDIVVELIGGIEEAKRLTLLAFKNGKSVVTANKALVCEHGQELLEAANEAGVKYLYEASVAGGIPIIKVIQEAFVGNDIHSLQGILNGTSNYILTRMEREQLAYQDVLKEAQKLGYVEKDEALDLDGIDAAHKLIILAYLCYHQWFPIEKAHVEGIRTISLRDIASAKHQGYKIKLIATLRQIESTDKIECSVRPCLVPLSNNLASVDEVFNGVCVEGDIVGTSFLIGRGAGREPTTSAVLSDIIDLCRTDAKQIVLGGDSYQLAQPSDIKQSYYIRIEVADIMGVLSEITQILSQNDISISTIEQVLNKEDSSASIMLTTHVCSDQSIQKTCETISSRAFLKNKPVVFPILEK